MADRNALGDAVTDLLFSRPETDRWHAHHAHRTHTVGAEGPLIHDGRVAVQRLVRVDRRLDERRVLLELPRRIVLLHRVAGPRVAGDLVLEHFDLGAFRRGQRSNLGDRAFERLARGQAAIEVDG